MSNENIFREVDEELRSERMRNLWRRFGPFIIGAAVAVVVVVAANEGWSWWQQSRAAEASEEFYVALDLAEFGDLDAARQNLEQIAAEGYGGYPVLARFSEAGLLAEQGETEAAIEAYDALASTSDNQRLRELALVLAGMLLVDSGTVDDVEARVSSIAAEEGPMRNPAREALGLAHYQAEDYAAARENFEAVLSDPLSQDSTRTRMSFYLAQLVSMGEVAPDAVPDEVLEPEDAGAAETAE
ncbi:membrane protein [Devosia pacifica]|uniref:Membrane protein n=1 Tax=Devosia pacifica TaxID=1335967 RepID=A0A918SEN7_9HYPH|nr:tetratricopeptide repeat protein [Devosia pacifica]GHA35187.1 membrane protein [Devosia pacifica]